MKPEKFLIGFDTISKPLTTVRRECSAHMRQQSNEKHYHAFECNAQNEREKSGEVQK